MRSVANLTRADGEEFLALAPQRAGADDGDEVSAGGGANDALADLRAGRFTGAAVVVPDTSTSGMGTSSDPLP